MAKDGRSKAKKLKANWDIYAVVVLVIGTAIFNLSWLVFVQGLTTIARPYISAVYKKVEICLTSASILLAALGLVLSAIDNRKKMLANLTSKINRAFAWYLTAVFASLVNVAVMPTSRRPDEELLAYKHAALWLWLYLTGPISFFSLILGTFWFLRIIRAWTEQPQRIEN